MASPERERVDAAAADAAQRLRGKVMCGLSCKAGDGQSVVSHWKKAYTSWFGIL